MSDTYPGFAPGFPKQLTNVNGILCFEAAGWLWKSDGTSSGTVPITDATGSGFPFPQQLIDVGGVLYFIDRDSRPVRLWKSDGSSNGTVLVRDLTDSFIDYPLAMTNANGILLFRAYDSTHLRRLYKSDGTSSGTTPVPMHSPLDSDPQEFVDVGGAAFFTANSSRFEPSLWKRDSTETAAIANGGLGEGSPSYLTNVSGTLYFAFSGEGGRELWKSTGTLMEQCVSATYFLGIVALTRVTLRT